MRIVVDRDLCVTHAQCVLAAPTVFRLDEQGDMVCDAQPDESLRAEVMAAVEMCPMQAITLED